MTLQDIEDFKAAFLAAVRRAVDCGFDIIEIHNGTHVC
jgi:2,4-dienoyl-CoA reductase-like NADH-dependent reductase (Old Yellow Enzyme family)